MKISQLKLNQCVIIDNVKYFYKGIQKVRISGFGVVQKIVFEYVKDGVKTQRFFNINEGNKQLQEINAKLIK